MDGTCASSNRACRSRPTIDGSDRQVDLDKTFIRAGVDGRVEQFGLRPGDIVTPNMRTAGVLIPEGAGRRALMQGLGRSRRSHQGWNVAEATCVSKPWTIIPMVVTVVQDYTGLASSGARATDRAQNTVRPGTILVFMEPIYKGGLEGVTPGSSCVANAYTSNHELITSGKIGSLKSFALHVVTPRPRARAAVADQALLLPIPDTVLGGHECCLTLTPVELDMK